MPSYINYPMVLNNVYVGMVGLRTDQKTYFSVPDATEAELALAKYRTSGTDYERNYFPDRLDSLTPSATTITVKRTSKTKDRAKDHIARGGRRISIPTELKSTPPTTAFTNPSDSLIARPNIRYTIIRFPGAADISEISAWLYLKLVSKKPKYMKIPGGRTYLIAPFGSGTVTGTNTTP